MERRVRIQTVEIGEGCPLALIAGPCVIESRDGCLRIAEQVKAVAAELDMPAIFKASYDKANRTSLDSFRGPGLHEGLGILRDVKEAFGLPVLSDVHTPQEAATAAAALDALQIPAFLCRQTDLILAAAETGKPVNVKKGQFLSPWDMAHVVAKVRSTGNANCLLTERGASFGYNNLVSDMRAIPVMQELGCPVAYDATHSPQLPGGGEGRSGGQREMTTPLALAAVATGCDALFLEVHDRPEDALSDAATMLPLSALPELLRKALAVHQAIA